MPRKIRELRADLSRAGFTQLPGKGSHTKWEHPLVPNTVVISGHDGADAQPYQEKQVKAALQALAKAKKKP
jgi:predicted RNA binding protein YcfA (HicA-like mRNA interferase family)